MDSYWAAFAWSIIPTIVVGSVFFFVVRAVMRADRSERRAYTRIEAEERKKRGMPPAGGAASNR